MERFDGRVAIVTGGASGIGEATVRRLVAEGARVVIADLDDDRGHALADELGDVARFERCDVSDAAQVDGLVETAVESFARLDVLVSNAGIGVRPGNSIDLDPAEWQRVIAVNLNSVFFGIRSAVPRMRATGGGSIVNTASISGMAGDYGLTAYCAAKGGVINYTRSAALDHASEGIRVNAVCPGFVATPLTLGLPKAVVEPWIETIPIGRAGEPADIAAAIAFLGSDDAAFVTGAVLAVDGGRTAATGQPDVPGLFGRL